MKCGVVLFPGSNCDHDAVHLCSAVLGQETVELWHQDTDLQGCDFILVPGGFSYGDYLRAGSMAALSPVMKSVQEFADQGGLVLGICNGFQILLEAGLLPGAMRRNRSLRFLGRDLFVRVERNDLPYTRGYEVGQVLRLPVAHAEGNYVHRPAQLEELEASGQVVFRYCNEAGEITEEANLNGSENAIAGICNKAGNVMALMPHPERCAEEVLGNTDGLAMFQGLLATFSSEAEATATQQGGR